MTNADRRFVVLSIVMSDDLMMSLSPDERKPLYPLLVHQDKACESARHIDCGALLTSIIAIARGRFWRCRSDEELEI